MVVTTVVIIARAQAATSLQTKLSVLAFPVHVPAIVEARTLSTIIVGMDTVCQ